jgi:hypothetical protein
VAVASPGGREIGRVSVRVVPDTSRFGTDTEKYLKRVEKTLKVSIPTALDSSGVVRDMAKLKIQLRAFSKANKVVFQASIQTGAVTAAVKSATRKAVTAAKSTPIKVPVQANQDDFNASMRALGKKLAKQAAFKLTVDIEGERTRQKLKALVKKLETQTGVKVPLDPVAATSQRNKIANLVRKIQDIAETLPPPDVPVALRADTDPLIAQLKLEGKRIADRAKVRLPIEATDEADSLKRLVDKLEATTSVKLPATVEERSTLRTDVQRVVRDIERIADRHAPKIRPKLDFIDKLFDVARFKAFAAQVTLITARSLAYVALLGPAFLVAAAGATALVSSLAVGLPALGALAAGAAALALGFDALFGPKVDGKRLGGVFLPVQKAITDLRVEVGALITQGMDPLIARLTTTAFPVFAVGMKQVAVATSGALREMLAFASSAQVLNNGQALFSASARSITALGRSFTFFASGLLTLTVAAIPAMQRVSEGVVGLAARFSGFLQRASESGALQRTINNAVADTGAFISGVARIAGELVSLLVALRPIAERTFSVLGQGLSGIITGLDRILRNFTLGGHSLLVPLGDALTTIITALQSVTAHILETLALLAGNDTFQQFILSIAAATGALAAATAKVVIAATDTVSAISSVVGAPIVALITGITNALAGFITALSNSAIAVGLLATALIVRLAIGLKVLLAARLAPLLAPLVLIMRAVAVEAVAAAVAMQTFGVRAAVSGVVAATATAVRGLTGALAGLYAAVGAVNVLLIAAVAGFAIYQAGSNHLKQATAEAEVGFGKLTDSISGLDKSKATAAVANLNKVMDDGRKLNEQYNGTWGTFRAGWDAITKGPLTKAAGQFKAASSAIDVINAKTQNTTNNLNVLARETGIAYDTLAKIASDKNVDLSAPFKDPEAERARKELLSDLDQVAAVTGLTSKQVIEAVGPSREAWQQYGQAVADALKTTQAAFDAQTNLISNIDLDKTTTATDALTKAEQNLTKARRGKRELEERLAVTRIRTGKQQVTANQQVAASDQKIADAEKAVAAARAGVNKSSIDSQVNALVHAAEAFNNNIDALLKRGLNPKVIQDLLLAGPKVAGPIAQAMVSDNKNRLIKLYNDSAAILDKINVAIIEKQRLITTAINDTSSPQRVNDLAKAFDITAILRKTPDATAEDIAKKLGLTPFEVGRVAGEFGYTLKTAIKEKLAETPPIKVTLAPDLTLFEFWRRQVAGDPVPVPLKPDTTQFDTWWKQPVEKVVKLRWVADNVKGVPGTAMAAGGLVKGPGTWTSDSILARLSNREFVQPSRTVAHYGVGVMEALRHRRVPRELLNAIASGNYALAAKLVNAGTVASRVPAPVRAVRAVPAPDMQAPAEQTGPRTLTIVDHDGVFRGQMRVAATKSHRDRAQAERLRRLGNWSS